VDWLKHQRDAFGDEIGVHIHPYCNFVDTTTVTSTSLWPRPTPVPSSTRPSEI
jgi:hypothetical protein